MSPIKETQKHRHWIKLISSLGLLLAFVLCFKLLWPAIWNGVILPKASSEIHGMRIEVFKKGNLFNAPAGKMESLESYAILDRPGHQALAFAVWEVPVSGQYRFFLETDSACDLLLDGASLCRIQGFYPQNGNGKIQYLPKGPHLLLFQFSSGPNKGWVDLKVQPPGQTDFARIKPAQLRYVTLNNFPEWWMIFHFLKWALIIGACFVFLFLWRTELSVFLRSGFLFSWLAARHPFLWAGLGLITIVSILGIWPFSWNYLILPRVNNNNPGFQVEAFVDKEMTGSPLKKYSAPLSILNLEPTQAALRAYAVWRVPHTGVYRLNVACMGYGHLTIDEQRVVSFPERVIDQSESVYYHLNQGLHLVRLNLFNFGHPGSFSLTASGPGSSEAQLLTGQELSGLPVDQMVLMMRIVDYGKYTGLIGLSLALILLFIKLGHWDTRLSLFLKQAPLSFYAMGVSVIVALSLILRIIFLLDIPDPAVIPKGMALGGLLSAFGSLGGIFYIFLINRLNKESADQSWDGLEAIALMAIMAIAAILRVLFLPNMEFKSDEKEMVHMAINLGRDHIPYVVGNLTSHGNRNPAGFLYTLSLPAFISTHPLHITLYMALLNILTVFMAYRLLRDLIGWRAAAVSALLFACSPWAIRCSMKVWPHYVIAFYALGLCLSLRAWHEKGKWWHSVLLGVTASLLAQLHFSSLLLLGGLGLSALIFLPRIPWKRLPLALLVFFILWLPYIYYQAKQGPDSGHIIEKYINEFPGGNLETVRNVYWEIGGFFLDSDEAMGSLGKEFRASVFQPLYGTFYVWVFLTLFGLYVFEFRYRPLPNPRGPDPVDWLKLFIWATIIDLVIQVMINVRADISYVVFIFPWPFVLTGLWVYYLEKTWSLKRLGRRLLFLPFLVIIITAISGAAYFWNWQSFLGRTGGDGEYGAVFYREEAAAVEYIKSHRPIPGPNFGPETQFNW